jgi:hypothetical protein
MPTHSRLPNSCKGPSIALVSDRFLALPLTFGTAGGRCGNLLERGDKWFKGQVMPGDVQSEREESGRAAQPIGSFTARLLFFT